MTTEARSASEKRLIPDDALARALRKALDLDSGEITVAILKGLRTLDASEQSISDLTGLEHCNNLIGLSLESNNVTNLKSVSSLFELEMLSLNLNPVSDMTEIGELPQLRSLFIGRTNVSSLKFVTNLKRLELLSFVYSRVTSLVELYFAVFVTKDNQRLQQVHAYGNRLDPASLAFAEALRNAGIEVNL
jgi:Leucine-rich repeat (LRR) protein